MTDTLQCPECGWTGERDDVRDDGDGVSCPICAESAVFVD